VVLVGYRNYSSIDHNILNLEAEIKVIVSRRSGVMSSVLRIAVPCSLVFVCVPWGQVLQLWLSLPPEKFERGNQNGNFARGHNHKSKSLS